MYIVSEVLQELSFEEDDVAKSVLVDFGMRSDVLDPKAMTDLLQIQPSRSWAKGEQYLSKTRDPVTKQLTKAWYRRSSGIWAIDSKACTQTKRVEYHIQYLLNMLEPKQEQIKFFVEQQAIYSVSFYIRWEPKSGHGSYEISNSTLSRMSALCHYIEFSFL